VSESFVLATILMQGGGSDSGASLVTTIISIIVGLLSIACVWMIFTKAGEAGWQSIIPIWSTVVLLRIIGRPWWWLLLLLVPFLNIVIYLIMTLDLGKAFGQGAAFSIFLLFFLPIIGMLILAFGGAQYQGARA
jgi:hypothetical protein